MCGYTFNLFGDCSQIKLDVKVISDFNSITADPIETCPIGRVMQRTA